MSNDLTTEGERLVEQWSRSKDEVQHIRDRLNSAVCNEYNAASALIKWLLPDDAQIGEKIAVWHGDSLIQVEVTCLHPLAGKLTVRTQGNGARRRGLAA